MNVNFEYYKIFFYVAKYHNFTKAAHVLGNSQPNVTRAMNCLEQQINTLLFVRTNRGVELTPEGEKLYIRVSAAMAQIFEAEEELSDSMSLSHGSISIGASETALNIFLLDKLKAFHMVTASDVVTIRPTPTCSFPTKGRLRRTPNGDLKPSKISKSSEAAFTFPCTTWKSEARVKFWATSNRAKWRRWALSSIRRCSSAPSTRFAAAKSRPLTRPLRRSLKSTCICLHCCPTTTCPTSERVCRSTSNWPLPRRSKSSASAPTISRIASGCPCLPQRRFWLFTVCASSAPPSASARSMRPNKPSSLPSLKRPCSIRP